MPLRLVVAPLAQSQIDVILRTSTVDFGEAAGARYRMLLASAFRLLAEHPTHAVSRSLSLDHETVRLFHLRHARHLMTPRDRVASPRHVIAYRHDDLRIEIAQVLHDRMDIPARLR
ncbi:type II toxin-antitoxin system RelE/ParE family toxin [Brevundimonas sp. SH203]|uniref:type II toxin-antitoxin system RelE/ParE family toxin n=1 Tax=Brevundimonas sp. SH203 TaxID=345167 RepID=UPI000B361F97|nr:type II toxin-antitoxin system RelE/ParE family toxin [Brevundimonas sp. SH203]